MGAQNVIIDVTDTISQMVIAGTLGGIQRVVLAVCNRLGMSATLTFTDFKKGASYEVYANELDFYAINETFKFQIAAPCSVEEKHAIIQSHFARRPPFEIVDGSRVIYLGGPWNFMPYASQFIKKISTCSDVIFLIHDLLPITHPQFFKGGAENFQSFFSDLKNVKVIKWVAGTASVAEQISRLNFLGPVSQIPFGFEYDILRPAKNVNESLLGLSNDNYVLLVGAIDGRKRHDLIVDTWLKSGIFKDLKLLIYAYAANPDDPFFAKYEAARHQTHNIAYLPNAYDDELARALRYCRFVIYPSAFEGWGLPISEASYFGKYCLTMCDDLDHHNNAIPFTQASLEKMAKNNFKEILTLPPLDHKGASWYQFADAILSL